MNVRPTYERPEDRAKEQSISDFLVDRWDLDEVKKINDLVYGVDRALLRGRDIHAFAEMKNRDGSIPPDRGIPFGFRDGYYISLGKVIKAEHATGHTGRPCFFVVRFTGGEIAAVNIKDRKLGAIWFGRQDRNDRYDMEPCCVYGWESFKVLNA